MWRAPWRHTHVTLLLPTSCTPHLTAPHWAPYPPACPQEKYPGLTVASFDTTEEKLENVAGDLGVKGLPQFRFYKVRARVLGPAAPAGLLLWSAGWARVCCRVAAANWLTHPPPVVASLAHRTARRC